MKALKSLRGIHIRIHSSENDGNQQLPVPGFVHKRPLSLTVGCLRPRTRSTVTIWNLPDSVIVHLLKDLHIQDLLSFRSVHPTFRDIIDNSSSIWANVSFFNSWPCEDNLHHYINASEKGNVEATIKLAVAYLYKEGLTKESIAEVGSEAAKYLTRAEKLTPKSFPFFWIFIRPPWSPDGSCCKVQAFHKIKKIVDETQDRDLAFGVGLTMKLQRLSLQGDSKEEEEKYFKIAVKQYSAAAVFFSLLDVIPEECDKAKELERIRLFRHLASKNILEARLNLIKCYTQGRYGGISKEMAREYVQGFFRSSRPSGIHVTFSENKTSDMSRYILVDWLVEVVGMKDFSAHTLYLAVGMFDRFLQIHKVLRSQVQLLGVAAMVISSRFLGFDILTIREAAWLTDNSYTYHDVVRMMGALVSTLKGNIRVFTIQDYVKVLLAIVKDTGEAAMLVEYIAMLCLLQSEMGQYSSAEIASSCMLLSRLLLNHADPWPLVLQEWTGFTQDYLSLCTFHIHKKCLLEGSEVEYRGTKLQAVKMRYADPNRYSVSSVEVIGHKELSRRLGVTKLISHGNNSKAIKFRNTDELIMSPRRGKGHGFLSNLNMSFQEACIDRNSAATPPIKNAYVMDDGISGYEGDWEDDSDESFSDKSDYLYELNEESDLDLSAVCDASDDSDISHDDEEDEAEKVDIKKKTIHKEDPRLPISQSKIVCLSSLCRFGNNLTCHSFSSSPSSCISNCSCNRSYNTMAKLNEISLKPSPLSYSSPSLLSTPTASSASFLHRSNATQSRNIQSGVLNGNALASLQGDWQRNPGISSSSCDNTLKIKNESKSAPFSFYSQLRKSKSSQDITSYFSASSTSPMIRREELSGECLNQLPCSAQKSVSERKSITYTNTHNDNVCSTSISEPLCQSTDLNTCVMSQELNAQDDLPFYQCNINSTPATLPKGSGFSHFSSVAFLYSSSSKSPLIHECICSKSGNSHRSLRAHTYNSRSSEDSARYSSGAMIHLHQPKRNTTEPRATSVSGAKSPQRIHCADHIADSGLPSTPEAVNNINLRLRPSSAFKTLPHWTPCSFSSSSTSSSAMYKKGVRDHTGASHSSKRAKLDYSLPSAIDLPQRQLSMAATAELCDDSKSNCDKHSDSNSNNTSVPFVGNSRDSSLTVSSPSMCRRKRKNVL